MRTVAIIPARGGSKGLPKKNIRLLAGKPLVAYMIEAAQATPLVDRIFVSTDSEEIAAVACRYGAEVITRPEALSGDTVSSEVVLLHALEWLEKMKEVLPDGLLLLQCTAPLTTPEDINGTIQAMLDNNVDSALAVVPFYHFLWREHSGKAIGINHDGKERKRRQDIPPQYLEAGSVYSMRVPAFLAERTRFCGTTSLYVSKEHHRCMEIDDAADFYQAEAMLPWFAKSPAAKECYRKVSSLTESLPRYLGAVVCDFDGVFTDNAVYTLQNGEESVRCDRGDGTGISNLKKHGVPVVVLSAEQNTVVAARCRKLALECLQGIAKKADCLNAWLVERGLTWKQIIYIGNDTQDQECLQRAGTGVIPCDAHKSVRNAADIVLKSDGGHGALRELSDMVCEALDAGTMTLVASRNFFTPYYAGQKEIRPWGTWEVLAVGIGYCIKKICVSPGGILSLQYHNHRDELWNIIKGMGIVTLDNKNFETKCGDIIKICKKQLHRIENISNSNLIFIEIQTGEKRFEKDIVRICDNYNREIYNQLPID